MAKSQKTQERKSRVSCLGVLLIVCMLVIAACTMTLNLMFKDGSVPKIGQNYYYYYNAEDMGERVPAGSLVIVEGSAQIANQSIVLYRTTSAAYRIAEVSLVLPSGEDTENAASSVYYLTTAVDSTPIAVSAADIVGVCTRRSPELGMLVGFLTGMVGVIVGLILPCLILLLYLVAALVAAHEAEQEDAESEDDTDLDFVRSIQKKQQAIAARDAKRIAKEKKEAENAGAETQTAPTPKRRLSDEELAKLEEEEAARRAERIAAVRSHMEQRRQSETPDGVPLYTTEIITKTHTLSIPRVGDKPLTTTQQRAIVLPVTGTLTKPSAADTAQQLKPAAEPAAKPVETQPTAKPALEQEAVKSVSAEPKPAETVTVPKPAEKPALKPTAPKNAPKPAAKPAAQSSATSSTSFADLMAFIDSEEQKLN